MREAASVALSVADTRRLERWATERNVPMRLRELAQSYQSRDV